MMRIPGLWLAVGAAALAMMTDVSPAWADDTGNDLVLPWGIYRSATGRYYQDNCDHGFFRHCESKHILPQDYAPVLVPRFQRRPRPLAGGYCQNQGGGQPTGPLAGTMAPTDVLAAYSVPASSHGYGKIVAVVDMPDSHIYSDLNVYRAAYNLPALPQCASGFPDGTTPCFAAVDELGRTANYTAGDCPGADPETALDVDMVSGACPDCSILVVQMDQALANGGPDDGDFLQGAETAAKLGAVTTSISFGGEEHGTDPTGYTTPGHLVFAAAGDSGYLDGDSPQLGDGTPEFPASSPDVLGVGGTTLVGLGGSSYAEKVWSEGNVAGGSGCSTEFPQPAFQTAFLTANPGAFGACTHRDSVDLASAAEFISGGNGGISIYDTASGGWGADIGTSAASPTVAAIFARIGIADATSNDMGFPYTNIASFNKVAVPGTNAAGSETCANDPVQCNADGGAGWNGPTGVGSPNATKLALLGTPNMPSAEPDAGPEGGSAVDSGSGLDSGSVVDSGSGSDAGGNDDAGSGSGTSSKSGCGCESVGNARSGGGGLALLGLLGMGAGALVVARRRRSRS